MPWWLPLTRDPAEEEEDDLVKIAIVGKPNVGKSSLLNRCWEKNAPLSAPLQAQPVMPLIPT